MRDRLRQGQNSALVALETDFKRRARLLGWQVLPTLTVSEPGAPRHLLLLPNGGIRLVELTLGPLHPVQVAWHNKARSLGTQVVVLYGQDHMIRWMARLVENLSPRPGRPGRPGMATTLIRKVNDMCAELDHPNCACNDIVEALLYGI